jgi:hypothetical protein
MKFTDWFQAEIKPVHVGVYPIRFFDFESNNVQEFAHWDGCRWGWATNKVSLAYINRDIGQSSQRKEWRGLAEKPN